MDLKIAATIFLVLVVVGERLISLHNQLRCRAGAPLPMKSLGNMPALQIELPRNNSDLVQVLTPGDLKRNLNDARKGNDLDTFLFIPAYSGLLISIGLILARGDDRWRVLLMLAALAAVPLAAVCDWLENAGIAATLQHFQNDGAPHVGDATRISTPSFIKWMTLALVLLFYGVAAASQLSKWNWPRTVIAVMGVGLGAVLVITLFRYSLERFAAN